MADVFAYTGYRRIIYFKFLDLQSGHTLVADPGGQYEIMATESGISVPPGDGFWTLRPSLPPPPIKPAITSKAEPVPKLKPVSKESVDAETSLASDSSGKAGE